MLKLSDMDLLDEVGRASVCDWLRQEAIELESPVRPLPATYVFRYSSFVPTRVKGRSQP